MEMSKKTWPRQHAPKKVLSQVYTVGNGHQLRHAQTRVLLALETELHYTHCTCSEGMCVSSIAMRLPRLFFGFTIVDVFHFMCAMRGLIYMAFHVSWLWNCIGVKSKHQVWVGPAIGFFFKTFWLSEVFAVKVVLK